MAGLTIRRKPGEQIQVGSAVITIRQVRGENVRVNIDAPPDVVIYRKECEDEWRASRESDNSDFD